MKPNEEHLADVMKFSVIYKFSISQAVTIVSDAYGLDPEALRSAYFPYHDAHCQTCKKTQNGGNN